jgi:isopenicillin-N N-acyltransferase-like protein
MNSIKPDKFYDTHIPYALIKGDTPFEIGFQHGKAAKSQISKSIEIYSKLYKDAKDVSWEEATRRSSKFKPLLETKFPEIQQELEGIASGSGRSFEDILTLNVRSEITLIDISDGCTSIGQRSKENNDVYIGQNWDWIPEIDEITIFLEIHQLGKPKILILAEAGIIGKYGFNSNGVAVMLNAISSNEVDYNKLPVHFAIRKALEAESVDDLIKYADENGIASAANFLVGDSTKYLTLELTTRGVGKIYPSDEFATVSHTNHLLDEHYQKLFPAKVPILSSHSRFTRINELNALKSNEIANVSTFSERLADLANAPRSILSLPVPGSTGLERCITLYTIIINTTKVEGQVIIGPSKNRKLYKLFFS